MMGLPGVHDEGAVGWERDHIVQAPCADVDDLHAHALAWPIMYTGTAMQPASVCTGMCSMRWDFHGRHCCALKVHDEGARLIDVAGLGPKPRRVFDDEEGLLGCQRGVLSGGANKEMCACTTVRARLAAGRHSTFSVVQMSRHVALILPPVLTVSRPSSASFSTASRISAFCSSVVVRPRSVPLMASSNLDSAAVHLAFLPVLKGRTSKREKGRALLTGTTRGGIHRDVILSLHGTRPPLWNGLVDCILQQAPPVANEW